MDDLGAIHADVMFVRGPSGSLYSLREEQEGTGTQDEKELQRCWGASENEVRLCKSKAGTGRGTRWKMVQPPAVQRNALIKRPGKVT